MENSPNLNGIYHQFNALVEQIDRTYDRIKNEKEWDHSYSSEEDEYFKNSLKRGDIKSFYLIYNSAKKEIEGLEGKTNYSIKLRKLPEPNKDFNFTLADTFTLLNLIKIESRKAIGVIEKIISPLAPNEINRLGSMERDFEKFYSEIDNDYENNIKKAIEEYKGGHILASTLISSRVIISAFDLLEKHIEKNKGKIEREKRTEKIIEFIIKNDLVKKHRETNQYLLKISKMSRNRFNHNIKSNPDSGDPLSLLDGCLKIVEILSNFEKFEKSSKN